MKKGEMVTCKNACPVTGQLSAMGKTASGNSGSKQKAIVSETKRMKRGGLTLIPNWQSSLQWMQLSMREGHPTHSQDY